MADFAGNVAVTMAEPIRDSLYAVISRHYGYMIHCKKNIQDFADEVDNLKNAHARVQTEVDAARANAEDIHDDVSKWLTKVGSSLPTLEQDKIRLVQGKDNLKCLDVCSRYRLGKEGKKKTPDVTKLIDDGNSFGNVGYRPPLTGIWHKKYSINYESFQSRVFVFEEIMKALKDDGTYKIGIHGMPGIGKTRMMEEVAHQAEKERLVEEIAKIVVSQDPILTDIQQKLAEGLNLTLDKGTEDARKGLLCNRLKNGKKILIMVDDIWNDKIKLEDIGIPAADDLPKGCKIILTSRMREECLRMGVQKEFEIGVLSENEALDLFMKTVGDFTERGELRSVAEKVCRECDRLPLAIVTIGAALQYEKEIDKWNNALEQLRHSKAYNIPGVSDKLYSGIQLSYKYLKLKDQQLCFLHCCLFPEDAEIFIDDLAIYGVGTRFLEDIDRESMEKARQRTRTLIGTLKRSNLLLNGRDQNFVKMHDVIRDVAISIALEEKDAMFLVKAGVWKWIDEDKYKQCKAISLRFNDDCVFLDDSECTEVCTLMLEFRNLSSKVPSSFFKVMEKLRVLQLCNVQISELPSSLKNLRMLRLYNCKLVNVAFLKEFKKLEILCIEDSDLKELAPEIGQLTSLRLLDVRYCYELKIIPPGVISSLSQLEELYIPDEFDQWVVKDNASLNELNSLKRLISLKVFVPDVVLLPLNEPLFKSLIRFQISIGSCFRYWQSATRILKLDGFPIKKELNILMEKAEVLLLENLPNGLCGSGSFGKLSSLKVVNCKLMIYLFSSATARNLLQLQELTISGCEIMEEIVRDDEEAMDAVIIFHHLKEIELKDLPKLRSFYANMKKSTTRGESNTSTLVQALFNHKVAFPALEELNIDHLESLAAIWEAQSQSLLVKEAQVSFQSLRFMTVRGCNKLVNVIASNVLPSLPKLERLGVHYYTSVEEIVAVEKGQLGEEDVVHDEIIVFPQLKYLTLEELPNLKSFTHGSKEEEETVDQIIPRVEVLFNHKVAFPALEVLYIDHLESLTAIWEGQSQSLLAKEAQVSFQSLRFMSVTRCDKLVNVIASNVLPSLQKEIIVVEREQLIEEDVMHDEIIVFPQLKYLTLEELPNLKSFTHGSKEEEETVDQIIPRVEVLFNHKVRFPALEELKIKNLKSLMAIWDNQLCPGSEGQDSFQLLRLVHVECSEKLVNVIPPNAIPMLHNLESLEIVSCDSVVSGVEMVAIEEGDDEILMFPQLKNLKLENLSNLKRFCYSTGGSEEQEEECGGQILVFSQLRTLRLEGLPKLSSFCCSRRGGGEELVVEESNIDQRKALFNHKVKFPCLEELFMKNLDNLEEIRVITISTDSISKLRKLELEWCRRLLNVASTELHTSFQNLEEVEVLQCESLQEVFKVEGSKGAEGTVLFPQVRTMRLEDLPKLSSFCCSTRGGEELAVEESNIPQQQALFNNKVRFPALEELKIKNLKSLMAIWDNQLCPGSEGQDSFQLLRLVHVECSEKLVNVIPPNAIPMLHNLESLEIVSCDSVVSGVELVAIEEGDDEILMFPQLKKLKLENLSNLKSFCYSTGGSKEEQEECGGKILVFSQLRTMRLEDLPKLSSFCCSRRGGEELVVEESNIPQQQALFNNKVAFLALEKLSITNLESLEAIWDDQSQSLLLNEAEDSFRFIECIEVNGCNKVVNVIPANVLPRLQNLTQLHISKCHNLINVFSSSMAKYRVHLQELKVTDCEKMEEIVAVERGLLREDGEEDLGHDEIIVFHKLKHLTLQQLPNLNSFCSTCGSEKEEETAEQNFGRMEALFNYKVRFPALEELEIGKLQSLTVIWDKQLFLGSEAQNSFQLRFVTVHGCDKLANVIPTYAFPVLRNLESLKFVSCDSMVYGAEVAAIEEGSNEILMFPQLKKLELEKLPNLESLCYSNIGGSEEEGGGGKTLVFPQLNTIRVGELPKLSGICCSRRGGEESVLKESHIPQQQADLFNYKVEFPMLEKLVLGDGSIFGGIWKNCNKVRIMEVKKYINVVNACTLLQWLSLEVVEQLSLESCDSLEVIFNLEGLGAIERKAIVSSQAKELTLIDLPKLERIWIMESQGLLVFHNLTHLFVEKCNSLRYVFSLSIARGLTQLRYLQIRECSVMEEIVRSEGQGEEDDMEEIVFSQLEQLWLWELPNLTCFCGTNNAFNFPSLKWVSLWKCPKLQTFTSGGISTSGGIILDTDDQIQRDVSDLNSHVQRWLVEKGKEEAEDN